MTVREIMRLTKIPLQTIRDCIKKELPCLKTKRGQTIRLSQKQSILIMDKLKKTGFVSKIHENREVVHENREVNSFETAIVSMNNLAAAIMANVQKQDLRIEALETKFQKRQDLLPAPQIPPRREISKIIADYVKKTNGDYRDSWHELYTDFFYRTGSNHSLCAKNRGMKTIDYIEQEGQISGLLATARELFGGECG